MRVAVLGSGGGALAAAADMSRHGRAVTLVEVDARRAGLEPVAARSAVTVRDESDDDNGESTYPVAVADDLSSGLDGAELVIAATPAPDHDLYVNAIAPHVTADQTVLFLGEGSGAIVARRVIDSPTVIAGANTPPMLARPAGPGTAAVTVTHRPGEVLIAALPTTPPDTARAMDLVSGVWPWAKATDTVWNTVLTNYRAIADATVLIGGRATVPDRTGEMLLGDGATPAVVRMIDTIDSELLALRRALNSKERRGYRDFQAAVPQPASPPAVAPQAAAPQAASPQAAAPKPAAPQAASPQAASPPAAAPQAASPQMNASHIDAAYALVLASSLGSATGVPTPGIDGLVDGASAVLGRDFRTEGRTLAALGLDGLDTTGLIGFARSGLFP